jgi:hypothetical protein
MNDDGERMCGEVGPGLGVRALIPVQFGYQLSVHLPCAAFTPLDTL